VLSAVLKIRVSMVRFVPGQHFQLDGSKRVAGITRGLPEAIDGRHADYRRVGLCRPRLRGPKASWRVGIGSSAQAR
jgi:hypothetical protein